MSAPFNQGGSVPETASGTASGSSAAGRAGNAARAAGVADAAGGHGARRCLTACRLVKGRGRIVARAGVAGAPGPDHSPHRMALALAAARAWRGRVAYAACRHLSTPVGEPQQASTAPPLAGVRVLDVGQVVAGNFCGALLAYFGADVVKVEPPGAGDPLRGLRALDGTGTSLWWRSFGRNRRCVAADLRTPGGQEVVRRLAGGGRGKGGGEKSGARPRAATAPRPWAADILIENYTPGRMEAWGLGPGDLAESLVYVRIRQAGGRAGGRGVGERGRGGARARPP